MRQPINNKKMIFHTLAIACTHFNTRKMEEIAHLYNHHVSFSTLGDHIVSRFHFHVFLISQKQKDYLQKLRALKIEYPHSIFVLLLESTEDIESIIQSQELFFLIDSPDLDLYTYSMHQLWNWLLSIGNKKIGLNNTNISIAGGILSLTDEIYQKGDKVYRLTNKQMELFQALVEHRGNPVSRIYLIEKIWASEKKIVTDRVIDTNIVALRKMLDDSGRNPKYLQTIFGQGYRLVLD